MLRCYPPRSSASVDNNLLDLQNSSYPTQPHSIIAKSLESSSEKLFLQSSYDWLSEESLFITLFVIVVDGRYGFETFWRINMNRVAGGRMG